ncbi:hypothetical protein BC567DRAFT_92186 [Phyllosticta citribraziliensis]
MDQLDLLETKKEYERTHVLNEPLVTELHTLYRDSVVVRAVVEHMYFMDYNEPKYAKWHEMMLFQVGVFDAAFFLDVPSTQELASSRFEALVRKHWKDPGFGDVVGRMAYSFQYIQPLRAVCFQVMRDNGWSLLEDAGFCEELRMFLGKWGGDRLIGQLKDVRLQMEGQPKDN